MQKSGQNCSGLKKSERWLTLHQYWISGMEELNRGGQHEEGNCAGAHRLSVP
jgi:hypothetical protein